MTKPIVEFAKGWGTQTFVVGDWAYVWVFNHPRLGETDVSTSTIVEVFPDGSFETLNTKYVPVERERDESKKTPSNGFFW